MSADASAYAALGLEPGADAAAIERAYKVLIKRFHPDRAGGDSRRAAEINRAYRELRRAGQVKQALDLDHGDDRRRFPVRTLVAVLAGVGAVGLVAVPLLAPGTPIAILAEPGAPSETIDQPIVGAEVDAAVNEAWRLSRTADEMALASASRDCHLQLRRTPRLALLDRCAALDNAAVNLLDRDPLRDRGPFSGLAVTGRLMRGARLFSDDALAIDSRLDVIRVRVELSLAARAAPPLERAPPAG